MEYYQGEITWPISDQEVLKIQAQKEATQQIPQQGIKNQDCELFSPLPLPPLGKQTWWAQKWGPEVATQALETFLFFQNVGSLINLSPEFSLEAYLQCIDANQVDLTRNALFDEVCLSSIQFLLAQDNPTTNAIQKWTEWESALAKERRANDEKQIIYSTTLEARCDAPPVVNIVSVSLMYCF